MYFLYINFWEIKACLSFCSFNYICGGFCVRVWQVIWLSFACLTTSTWTVLSSSPWPVVPTGSPMTSCTYSHSTDRSPVTRHQTPHPSGFASSSSSSPGQILPQGLLLWPGLFRQHACGERAGARRPDEVGGDPVSLLHSALPLHALPGEPSQVSTRIPCLSVCF